MFRHCVLGVDFSDGWDAALPVLPALAENLGIERLTLVNVDELHRWQRPKNEEGHSRSVQLEYVAEDLNGKMPFPVDYQVRRGFPASELLKAAEELGADAVIATNRSHSTSREFFGGNVALNLARMTKLPLIIVPIEATAETTGGPFVLATDGSDAAKGAESVFGYLAQSGAQGRIIIVDDDDDAATGRNARAHVDQLADYFTDNVSARTVTGDVAEEVTEMAKSDNARLIILGKRGHTPLPELLLGSKAEAVCRLARNPVLLVPRET